MLTPGALSLGMGGVELGHSGVSAPLLLPAAGQDHCPCPREPVGQGEARPWDLGCGVEQHACPPACPGPAPALQSQEQFAEAGGEPQRVPTHRRSAGSAGRLQAGSTAGPTSPGWRRRSDLGVELADTVPLRGPGCCRCWPSAMPSAIVIPQLQPCTSVQRLNMGAETCTPVPQAPQYLPMPGVAPCPGSVTIPCQGPCLAAMQGQTPVAARQAARGRQA